jgi:hypothetical protein
MISYLKSLKSVREQAKLLLQNPQYLQCFDLNLSKMDSVVEMILSLIKRDYPIPQAIPSHSRWRHFIDIDLSTALPHSDPVEKASAMIDLFVVSVLLDAGAGDAWKYTKNRKTYNRSEGLAVSSFEMFSAGLFSSTRTHSHNLSLKRSGKGECDAVGLQALTKKDIITGFQVSETNPLIGVDGRTSLLNALGTQLSLQKEFFLSTFSLNIRLIGRWKMWWYGRLHDRTSVYQENFLWIRYGYHHVMASHCARVRWYMASTHCDRRC